MKHLSNSNYPEDRKRIHIFKSVNNTTHIVNYMADNNNLNTFLSVFDIWGNGGKHVLSDDNNHSEVWFEADSEFYVIVKTPTMQNALKKFGVVIFIE